VTTRLTSRIAALGAAVAVGTAGLVAVSPSAGAASGSADYTCATSLGDQVVTVTTKVAFPAKAAKGTTVAAKKVTLTVTLSEGLTTGLRGLGVTSLSGSAEKVKAKVGTIKVPLKNVAFKDQKVPASGSMKIKAKGTTASFKLKKPGTYAISIPKRFVFSAQDQNGNALISDSSCALNAGEKSGIGSIKVAK
jgi:hypothetical protein